MPNPSFEATAVVETKSGKLAATIPVVLQSMGSPTKDQFFAEAWRCAVADKSVDPSRNKEYTFAPQKV
jgi:hypothetical protein